MTLNIRTTERNRNAIDAVNESANSFQFERETKHKERRTKQHLLPHSFPPLHLLHPLLRHRQQQRQHKFFPPKTTPTNDLVSRRHMTEGLQQLLTCPMAVPAVPVPRPPLPVAVVAADSWPTSSQSAAGTGMQLSIHLRPALLLLSPHCCCHSCCYPDVSSQDLRHE